MERGVKKSGNKDCKDSDRKSVNKKSDDNSASRSDNSNSNNNHAHTHNTANNNNNTCKTEVKNVSDNKVQKKIQVHAHTHTHTHTTHLIHHPLIHKHTKIRSGDNKNNHNDANNNITDNNNNSNANGTYIPCDVYALVAYLYPEIVQCVRALYCVVETTGTHTRGMLCFDWYKLFGSNNNNNNMKKSNNNRNSCNASVVCAYNRQMFLKCMIQAVQSF